MCYPVDSRAPQGPLTPAAETHLSCPISQKPINRGGTPTVMQKRWSCTWRRAGPLAIFALGGADVICIRNCWSVGKIIRDQFPLHPES